MLLHLGHVTGRTRNGRSQPFLLAHSVGYDPACFNDRLLLGMKGTMSEAELHMLRARLRGGILNKARRGELRIPLPIGLSYNPLGKVVLTPDSQVQDALYMFFKTYKRTGSASAIVKHFRKNSLQFPRLLRGRINKGIIVWGPLTHTRALHVLHNPRYAGAFVYGRMKSYKQSNGRISIRELPIDQWQILIPDTHPGYITWDQYNDNRKTLRANSQAHGKDPRNHPPGNGPALLQGLIICGVCGQRMTLRYHERNRKLVPDYVCQRQGIEYGKPTCQHIPGSNLDKAVGQFLLELVKPVTLEIAFTVQQEVQQRLKEADKLRYQKVQRAQYQTDLAKDRFMNIDPRNRLVADQLEADWNDKLRVLADAREEYELQHALDEIKLDKQCREKILSLVKHFPKVWNDPGTTHCAMVADIEQEYSSHVCNVWQETSNIAKLDFELHPEPERTYDAISLASGQFLQEKLKTLEAEETLLRAD